METEEKKTALDTPPFVIPGSIIFFHVYFLGLLLIRALMSNLIWNFLTFFFKCSVIHIKSLHEAYETLVLDIYTSDLLSNFHI